MKKYELHYSICSMWLGGRKDEALQRLLGERVEQPFENQAMIDGRRIHETIANNQFRLMNKLSPALGYEVTKIIPLSEELTYCGTIDMIDYENRIIYDWKSGTTDVRQHSKMQLYCYSLLFPDLADWGIMVKVKENNGYIQTGDYAKYKLTPYKKEIALNYLTTVGNEMVQAIHRPF